MFSFLLTDVLGGGVVAAALSLTAIYIPQYFRVVRNTTVSARGDDVRRGGPRDRRASRSRSCASTSSATSSSPCRCIGTLNAADALGTLAALGFLGLGIQPTEASEWGYDLSRALDDAQAGIWWTGAVPGPGDRRC